MTALQCSQCGAGLHAPVWAPTITCPLCGAFLSIERDAEGTRTALAPEELRRDVGTGPPVDEGRARLALREFEESLREVQNARHRRTGTALMGFGLFGTFLLAGVVAVLWIGNWDPSLLLLGFSSRSAGAVLAVVVAGIAIALFQLRRAEIVKETRRKEQQARLEERIRQEKWAMYEEELEQRKGKESSEE